MSAKAERTDWLVAVLVAVTAAKWFSILAPFGLNPGEEGGTVYLFARTARGEHPHLDFISGYGAAYFYWHAALLRTFGESLLTLRWGLVGVHVLNCSLLFWVGRWLMPRDAAAMAAAFYVVMLPVTATTCSFNIPYPAWYTLFFWLLGLVCLDAAARRAGSAAGLGYLVLVGALCGLSVEFKPNTGLLNTAAALCGMIVLRAAAAAPFGRSLLAFAAGFLAAAGPWVVADWWRLGAERFLSEVLFFGAGFEELFYIPYRLRPVFVAAVTLAALVWARWVSPRTSVAVVAVAVLAFVAQHWNAPMPEGFVAAVRGGAEDFAFQAAVALPLLALLGLATTARQASGAVAAMHRCREWMVLLSAVFLLLGVFPRSDYFHLSYSAPLVWLLGMMLLSRWVRPAWLWRVAAPAALLLLALPQIEHVRAAIRHLSGAGELYRLPLERAPVLVPAGREGREARQLVHTVHELLRRGGPSGDIFTFPNLDLIAFLAGRRVPTRIGYFHPGWPDHLVEAEVVHALRTAPPPFAVVGDPPSLFFSDAPAYFLLIQRFLADNYVPVWRSGALLLMQHRLQAPIENIDAVMQAPGEMPPPIAATGRVDVLSRLGAWRSYASPAEAAWLAQAWARADALGLSDADRLALLRVLGRFGDTSAAALLLSRPVPASAAMLDEFAAALFNIALRGLLHAEDPARAASAVSPQVLSELWRLGAAQSSVRLRVVAAWLIGARLSRGDPDAELQAFAAAAASDGAAVVRLAVAASGLHGRDPRQLFLDLANQAASGSTLATGLLARQFAVLCPGPQPCLAELAAAEDPALRELSMVLAMVSPGSVVDDLVSTLREDVDTRVRQAAMWATRLRSLDG